jgi:hypothetical protein
VSAKRIRRMQGESIEDLDERSFKGVGIRVIKGIKE